MICIYPVSLFFFFFSTSSNLCLFYPICEESRREFLPPSLTHPSLSLISHHNTGNKRKHALPFSLFLYVLRVIDVIFFDSINAQREETA